MSCLIDIVNMQLVAGAKVYCSSYVAICSKYSLSVVQKCLLVSGEAFVIYGTICSSTGELGWVKKNCPK